MDFLWSLFEPFVLMVQKCVEFFHDILASFAGIESYGLSIIILTIVIKVLLYPLTVKQIKSMKAMQKMQTELKRIQQQYANDPARMQAEMQKLGINPMAGCLPMLVQMPILMAIYYALRDTTYQGGDPSFLWMPTLSEPDPYYILPILSMASTFFVQHQTADESNQQMKMMMYIMPLFIGWMSMNFSAGLVLYWVTMNGVQILQQWWMFRNEEKEEEAKKQAKKDKKKDKKGKKEAV